MALNKVTYVDNENVIYADNLNDIQDAIIAAEGDLVDIHAEIDGFDTKYYQIDTAVADAATAKANAAAAVTTANAASATAAQAQSDAAGAVAAAEDAEDAATAAQTAAENAEDAAAAAQTAAEAAQDAAEAAEAAAAAFEVDDTLTEAGKAAEAKAAGDQITNIKTNYFSLPVGNAVTIPNGTDYDTLKTPGNFRVLTASAAQSMTNCPSVAAHRLFVSEIINSRIFQIVYTNAETTPEFRRHFDGTRWGEWRRIAYLTDVPVVDKSFSISGAAADAAITGDFRNAVTSYANYAMDLNGLLPLLWYRGHIGSDGKVSTLSTNDLATGYTAVEPGITIKYEKKDGVNVAQIFEYDETKTLLRSAFLRQSRKKHVVGNDTRYIKIMYQYVPGSTAPTPLTADYVYHNFSAYVDMGEIEIVPPIGLHVVPKNKGVLNCIKRARQMTDIRWTPAVAIDRVNIVSGQHYADTKQYFQNQFDANREYAGLPYSQKNFIGVRVSLEAFITGAATPHSNECVLSTYAGDHNVASYQGTVCVTLVSYALHAPQLNSPNYDKMNGLTKLYDLYTNGVYHDIDDIELCDVLFEHGHVAIVTDIIRDTDDHVTHVEVSESTKFGAYLKNNNNGNYGGKCRRKLWPKNEFLQWFSSFALCRYADELLEAIPYYPCKYVPMEDETPFPEQAKLPCIPVTGDKSKYYLSTSSTRSVNVLVNETGYQYLRVKKNGSNFALLDVPAFGDADFVSVIVNCDSSSEGLYEAYLCNVTNGEEKETSAACSWIQIGSATNRTMRANDDGSYTFEYVRSTDLCYPIAVSYDDDNPAIQAGKYSPIVEYTKTAVSNGWKYTFTVTPPDIVTSFTKISLLLDFYDYGWAPTAVFTPTIVS